MTDATHVDGHILDLLITRASDQLVTDVRVSEDLVSDHTLVNFGVNISRPVNSRITRSYRKFSTIDCDDLSDKLHSTFSHFPPNSGPDQLCDYYNQSITSILDEFAPIVTKTVTEKPRAAWYSENADELTTF